MSRSGYSDDGSNWDLIRWSGAVRSAIRGRRGQAMLRELGEALDAMEHKRLLAWGFEDEHGEVCALGCLMRARGVERPDDPEFGTADLAAELLDVAPALAAEVMFINDDYGRTPEERWMAVREWVREHRNEETT